MAGKNELDVAVIGAGVSGINIAYYLLHELKGVSFNIFEARGDVGGTWDFFKYPGLRSDSDMHTFGFPFKPWSQPNSIGTGPQIKKYLRDTSDEFGITEKIKFHHRMIEADWSNDLQRWRLSIEADGKTTQWYARFLILGTGYYDYLNPLPASITDLDKFKGTIVHPQFWPEDLKFEGKRVAIIGSGATAITLLPSLAKTAQKVTMIQRSPSYIMPLPQNDPFKTWWGRILPAAAVHKIVRWWFLTFPLIFFYWCRAFPNAARFVMKHRMGRNVPKNIPMDPHFLPTYAPWEQRLCVSPDGDFYQCMHDGVAEVATGTIKSMKGNTIELSTGKKVEADILVTATGLKMQLAGGAALKVDGKDLDVPTKYLWQGMMLQDAPNAVFIIGYTNSSWTLGGDATAQAFVRIFKRMQDTNASSVTPTMGENEKLEERPLLNLNSTYIRAANATLPRAGNAGPWQARSNYFLDTWKAKYGDLSTGLQFNRVAT